MAGHDSTSSKGKANEETDVPIFSAENMQSNMKIIYYSRTFMSIIGGVIAGILGFTGLSGFILYFLIMTIISIGLVAKTEFSVNSYFGSWNQILLDGFLGGLMSFVLFWTDRSSEDEVVEQSHVLPDYNFTDTALRGLYLSKEFASLIFVSLFSLGFRVWL